MTVPALPQSGTLFPTQSTTEQTTYRVLKTQLGDAYFETADDGTNVKVRMWTIYYENIQGSDYATLVAFLDTVKSSQMFSWQPFGESNTYYFKIDQGSINRSFTSGNVYTVYFNITQTYEIPT